MYNSIVKYQIGTYSDEIKVSHNTKLANCEIIDRAKRLIGYEDIATIMYVQWRVVSTEWSLQPLQ